MRFRRFPVVFVLAFAGSLAVASVPEYSVSIEQNYAPHAAGKRVALLPLSCPQEIDCADLEAAYGEQLAVSTTWQVVNAAAVRELTANADLGKLTELERRPILAEGLQVDSFVKVDILRASVDRQAASAADKWRELRHREEAVTSVKIEVRVIGRDGTVLARASGDARLLNSIRSLNTVAAKTFQQTLDKLLSADA